MKAEPMTDGSVGSRATPRWFGAARAASLSLVERFRDQPRGETIFHYTSSTSLISVVANNELWLSEATYLNDRDEIDRGRRLARDRLKQALEEADAAELRAMLEECSRLLAERRDPDVYVACFSWEPDDLSQWRAYGGSAAPVAIELEPGPMMFGYTSEGILDGVLYEEEDQLWTFDTLLRTYAEAFLEDVRNPLPNSRGTPHTAEEEASACASKLAFDLWRYIVTCKDPLFRSEREVRFAYIAHDFSKLGHGWHPEHPSPRFRESSGRVIPYLSSKSLNFRNMEPVGEVPPLPIRSVRIGPTAEPELVARGIRRLLDAHGHDRAEITHSASTLRR